MLKNIRSIFPIPRDWEKDNDRRSFAVRVDQALRELSTRRYVTAVRVNDVKVEPDANDAVDLRQIVRYQFSVPNNGTRTLTFNTSSTYTFLMIAAANNSNNRGMWLINHQGSNSATSVDVIKSASNLTVTAGVTDHVITITKSGTVVTNVVLFLVYPITSNGPTITGT